MTVQVRDGADFAQAQAMARALMMGWLGSYQPGRPRMSGETPFTETLSSVLDALSENPGQVVDVLAAHSQLAAILVRLVEQTTSWPRAELVQRVVGAMDSDAGWI
jgi:hypothetical protein